MDRREQTKDFWRRLVGFLVPPVGVWMQVGFTPQFWLNVLFTLLFAWIGGQIHAAYVITTTDAEGGEQAGGLQRFIALLVAAYIPPLGVFLSRGLSGALVVNVLLSLLCLFPGSIHALWVIAHSDHDPSTQGGL